MVERNKTAGRRRGKAADGGGRARFDGWIMVAAAFAIMMVAFGTAYSFPAFFDALSAYFGADRGDTARVFGIAAFIYFILGAVSGPASDAVGARPVVVLGALVAAAGLIAASQAETIEQVHWGYGLGVGIGVGCMYVPAVGVVQRWFARNRSNASGLAVMGIGVGTFVGPHFAAWLIETGDWREAYLVFAAVVILFGGVGGLLLVNDPAERGQFPDGADGPPTGVDAGPALTGGQASRTFPFWMIFFAAMLISVALFVPFVHVAKFAEDMGLSARQGFWTISAIGVGSILGRLGFAPVAQKLGRHPVMIALHLGLALSMIGWNFSTQYWHLLLFGVAFGALYGGFVAIAPTLLSDYFGVRHTGSIIGFVYASVGVGALVGPSLAGDLFDYRQSYEPAILAAAALCLMATMLVAAPKDPESWRRKRFGEPSP